VDLAGYYLSDDADNPTLWQIPATNAGLTTVPAGGYLLFWADNETAQGANHLNFKLGGNGESLTLTAPDGVTVVDNMTFPALALDFGYGRLPDGSGNLSALTPASPASTNDNSQPKVETPVFSVSGGMYGGAQSVTAQNRPIVLPHLVARFPSIPSPYFAQRLLKAVTQEATFLRQLT